ncbi:MAG: MarR family winged helix-turn-helix transcriptional regulator [Thermoplasmata archaeon]
MAPLRPRPPLRRPPRSPDPFEGGPLAHYKSNYLALLSEVRALLRPNQLLLSDARALRLAGREPTRPKSIATALDISPASATELIDRLQRRGLVRRSADPLDRRSTVVTLTAAGTRMERWAAGRVQRMAREISRELGPDGRAALEHASSLVEGALLRCRARRTE